MMRAWWDRLDRWDLANQSREKRQAAMSQGQIASRWLGWSHRSHQVPPAGSLHASGSHARGEGAAPSQRRGSGR